jgi:hypothetical protein
LGGYQTAIIAVPGKNTLTEVIKNVLGEQIVKELDKNNEITLQHGALRMILVTERQTTDPYITAPALMIYPSKKLIDRVDSFTNLTYVLFIPWNQEYDLPEWINTWGAVRLGKTPVSNQSTLIDNPIVIEALKSLISSINVSTGISHPADKESAVGLFKLLKSSNERFVPEQIRAWLVAQANILPKYADDISNIAQAILDNKPVRGGQSSWNPTILETWRTRAKGN